MKSTLLRTFFEWALITSVLMSVGFSGWYYFKSRALRACESQMNTAQISMQYNRAVMNLLMSECQEYAKTNADMARLLAPPKPALAPAITAPAAKPGSR